MKVFLRTYGCRANQYDTEAVRGMLADAGAVEVDCADDADYAVFNSCTVTAAAEADLRADIRRASRANPSLRTVVMGCAPGVVARDEAAAPLRSLPTVESLIAGGDIASVGTALGLEARHTTRPSAQSGSRALLRIQDGCNEHCTFCATTQARGANRSRPVNEVIEEARALALSHPEIVLTGIHIGSYGSDIGTSLGELVEKLIGETEGARFRLTSIEATEVDSMLAKLLTAELSRVVPHLHAPLQSGSDAILRRMGRNWYTAESYAVSIQRLIGDREVFALSGDVIAGFPGETEADHAATMDLVAMLPFTALHVFTYSPRPGTAALRLANAVPSKVAGRRASELRSLAAGKSASYVGRRIGGMADVIAIGRGTGLTEDYLSVDISDPAIPRRSRFNAVLTSVAGRLTATPVPS